MSRPPEQTISITVTDHPEGRETHGYTVALVSVEGFPCTSNTCQHDWHTHTVRLTRTIVPGAEDRFDMQAVVDDGLPHAEDEERLETHLSGLNGHAEGGGNIDHNILLGVLHNVVVELGIAAQAVLPARAVFERAAAREANADASPPAGVH